MITELRIDNFAIIHRLELEFSDGLVTFTGETGAGKSIILDAITAVLGGRADATSIRSGAERASVEAIFRLSQRVQAPILEILEREDLLDDPNYLTLARDIRREGRTTARINGRSVSLGLLRELGAYLVDIHGQSEHLSLLNVRHHIGLLDRYAGCEDLLAGYGEVYRRLQAARRDLQSVRQAEQDASRRTDLLTFQAEEIEAAQLRRGEDDELHQDRTRLANAENLANLAQAVLTALDEGSPESPSASDLLGEVVRSLNSLAHIDPSRADLVQQAELAMETLADVSRELHRYQEQIEFNPKRLDQIEDRLDLIQNLKRKYGGSIEAILVYGEDARRQLDTIAHASERIAELEEEEKRLLEQIARQGLVLSEKRREAAERLAKGVEAELSDLHMTGARFAVDFQTRPDAEGAPLPDGRRVAFDATGLDRVEFLVAPNPGEGLKPMVKIASGGETARLMLALKNVLARADFVPTLIFDEIDQGIGGRVGMVVGQKLWNLGREHQVLCVTHLPQLAAYGDQHFRVTKRVQDGRTLTQVDSLTGGNRRQELAQMLGGVSEGTLRSAEEMLTSVREKASRKV
ncbi:MAG TPA: DNA repair protein RecN [Anaerolineaceae bacterium]|nr:DNA repair protein RecN [Anaerolineaceae bacterium]